MQETDLVALEHWLITESQYVRVRALATGETIEKTFERVADVLRDEAKGKFPGVDVITLLRWEVAKSLDLRSICYSEVAKMRELIDRARDNFGKPPPVPPTPPRTPSPVAGAMAIPLTEEDEEVLCSKIKATA